MFALILVAGTYFCGSLEKSQKLEPAKISCHTVTNFDFRNTKKHPKLVKISEENNDKLALLGIYSEAQEL